MKPTQKQMTRIKAVLRKVYSRYKRKGLSTIYLWGSVLTEDFNPNSSDIDSIGIVSNRAKAEDCKSINNYLAESMPEYKKFKLNYLYVDELNGKKIKSRLASVIHPSLLLLDLKHWKYVIGKKYSKEDFKLKDIDFDQAVQLNLAVVKKNHLPLFKKGDFTVAQYFIKNLIKVCHYLNQRDFGEHEFKYNQLLDRTPKNRKNVVKILLKIKKSNWDKSVIQNNLPPLIEFVNSLANRD